MELLILESALELFAEDGYNGTSMQSIAKKAGVSKGNLYNYFEGKEQLLEAVLMNGINQLAEIFDEPSTEILTENEFEHVIRDNFKMLRSNKIFWKLYYKLFAQTKVQLLFTRIFAPFLEQYLMIFEAYYKKKGDENSNATALLLGSVLDGVSLGYLMMEDTYPLDEVVDQIIIKFK